ncbi:hypothetical protein BDC45DRAFT_575615 [Circinella umbellata]|nr:hypothetical protein BDC45DRAFT_575612 [Circinella umbellata]KAI7847627.1 hypothetical protein BDC45DRAFT_575615 [Circinella umbellata]
MLNTSSDDYWSKDMVIEFFTYSHFIDNLYNEEAVGLARSASLTPFETMWYYHYRNEDVSGISWFEDLLKIDVEPSFSIVEDSIKEMDFSSLFTDEPIPPKPRDKDYVDDDEMEEILNGLDSIVESLLRRSDSMKSTESQLVDDANGYSEVPTDVMVSDIMLPVLRPEEVLDAKEFKKKIRSADNLKEIDYANNIGIDLDYYDKHTKAIFEVKKVLDGQQMIKIGYNTIKFVRGLEVERYHRSSKKYSVGYLPYKPDMETPCLQLRYNTERKLHEVRSPFSDYTGYLLVSDLTVVMNDENIANSLFRFDRRFNWPEQILMSTGGD